MKRTWKSILALSMVLILSLGICGTAFAEDPSEGEEGGEPEIVVPSITKQLEMPVGTTTPTVTFTFTATPISVDGDDSGAATETMPELSIADIDFSSKDESLIKQDSEGKNTDVKVVTKRGALSFAGDFPHAGVYVYEVKERQQSESAKNTASAAGQTYTYSEAVYTVTVVVANHDTYYPAHVDVDIIQVSGKDTDKLTNYAESSDNITDNFLFTNTYTKKADGSYTVNNDRTGTDALRVIVETEGELADKTKTFPVTISITPTTLETDTQYTVKITHSDGSYENDYDITKGFELKDGDIVSISGIVVGSTVSVSENNTDTNYKLTHEIKGTATDWIESKEGNYSASGTIYEGGNTVTLTYTRNTVSLEGITINNIPYVMMICCAAAGIVLVMVTSSRRRREQ